MKCLSRLTSVTCHVVTWQIFKDIVILDNLCIKLTCDSAFAAISFWINLLLLLLLLTSVDASESDFPLRGFSMNGDRITLVELIQFFEIYSVALLLIQICLQE